MSTIEGHGHGSLEVWPPRASLTQTQGAFLNPGAGSVPLHRIVSSNPHSERIAFDIDVSPVGTHVST